MEVSEYYGEDYICLTEKAISLKSLNFGDFVINKSHVGLNCINIVCVVIVLFVEYQKIVSFPAYK